MKKIKDFSKTQIYSIRNFDRDYVYIASTCQNLSQRMAQRRLDKRRARNRNIRLYVLMNEVDEGKFYIEQVEEYPRAVLFQIYDVFGSYLHLRFRLFSLDLIFGNTSS